MFSLPNIRRKTHSILESYGIVLSGCLIFLYYLWAAIDLFTSHNAHRGFQGYFFQFISVILLWGIVFLGAKLFDYRKKQKEEQEKNLTIINEYERRKMELDLVDEVTKVLNDAVNNPLAVISVSASSIRDRFEPDSEILSYLDSIDGALKRMKEVLADFQSYRTRKILTSLQSVPSRKQTSLQQASVSVNEAGEIKSV